MTACGNKDIAENSDGVAKSVQDEETDEVNNEEEGSVNEKINQV